MNWLTILVMVLVVVMALRGYRKGGLAIIFSMASGVLFLMLIIWARPNIDAYMTEHTGLRDAVQRRCETIAQNYVEDRLGGENSNGGTDVGMPEGLSDKIWEMGLRKAEVLTEESGIYVQIASGMTDMIISAVSLIAAYAVGRLALFFLSGLFGIASRMPVLGGIDRLVGLLLGLGGAVVVIWIAFGFAALMASGDIASEVLRCIYENEMLLYLYNNNIVLKIFMAFI